MAMLGLILVLFFLAILSPTVFPNSKVSKHNKDQV
ncbi:MAG: hypothetical protein ACI8QD_002147 [Cyclobacteriaceae bacterium]|jgi:hypothetical protein